MKFSGYLMILIILLTGFALVSSSCALDTDVVCNDMSQNDLNIDDSQVDNLVSNVDNNDNQVKSVIKDITYGENISGYINVTGHKGVVTIKITPNDSPIYANVSEDGNFSVDYRLNAGYYKNVYVSFLSDDGNISGYNYVAFTVKKASATLEVFCNDTIYMETGRALVGVSNTSDDGFVEFNVDYVPTIGPINLNEITFTYPWSIEAGFHEVYVYAYSENFEYNEYYGNFTVYKANPSMSVVIESNPISLGNDTNIFITLPDYVIGNVSYSIDNETWIELPLNNGLANFTIGKDLEAGDYTLFVKYSGDDNCNSTSSEVPFTVGKYGVKIIVDDIIDIEGSNITITINVVDDNGNPINEGVVSFELNGKTYKSSVVNGSATFDITIPSEGEYFVMVYFNGEDTKYNNASSVFTITSNPTPTPRPDPTPTPDPTPKPVPNPEPKHNVLDEEIGTMENTGNPLLILLITLSLLGIESFKRKF